MVGTWLTRGAGFQLLARTYDFENADSATFTRGHVMGVVPVVKGVPVVCDEGEEHLGRGQIFMQKHDWSTVRLARSPSD